MADPLKATFPDAAVAANVTDPLIPALEAGTGLPFGERTTGPDSQSLDSALYRNAQNVLDSLAAAVVEVRPGAVSDLLDLLLTRNGAGVGLYEDNQILFVLEGYDLAAGEPLVNALTRLTGPPHDVTSARDRLLGLQTQLVLRVLAIVTRKEEVKQQGGSGETPGPGVPTHIAPNATSAADWLPLERLSGEPLIGNLSSGQSGPPGRNGMIAEKLSPEELHGRLVNLRGFQSVPHASEVGRLKAEGEIAMRKKLLQALAEGKYKSDLSPEEREREIQKERKRIAANEKQLGKKSELSALERARLDYEEAKAALEDDPGNRAKKSRLNTAAERLTLYDPGFRPEGGPVGHGTSTFVVMQLEIPDASPIIAEGAYSSEGSHAETEALRNLQAHLDKTYDLNDPKVRERVSRGRLTVMPDQIVCNRKCRPDIARFAAKNGLTEIEAVYVVRRAVNKPLNVPLGQVEMDPAENKEIALSTEFRKRGLATAKTTSRNAASGRETLKGLPQFVVSEDLLSDDFRIEYRRFESNLPVPAPTGRRPPGPPVPPSAEADLPIKVRYKRLFSALKAFWRLIGFVVRTVLTALEILEPLLVFAEGLDASLGQRPADLYRKKISGLNRELRRQVLRMRRAENEAAQLSGEFLALHFRSLDLSPGARTEILGLLKKLEVETYDNVLSLLIRRDLARQSLRETEAQEEVARRFLYTQDRGLRLLFGSQDAAGFPMILSAHQALIRLRPVLRQHLLLLNEMIRLVNLNHVSFGSWFALMSGEQASIHFPDALLAPAVPDHKLGLPPVN